MKILFFSDLHAHPFKEGHVLDNGLNSRLVDCISAMEEIYEFALSQNIRHVCFGGDLFHTRRRVDTSAINEVLAVLSEYSDRIKSYFLVGNHDQYDKLGAIHALEPLEYIPNVEVIDKPKWVKLFVKKERVYIFAVPYIHDSKKFFEELKNGVAMLSALSYIHTPYLIGFFHVGIDGTKVGQGKYAYSIDSNIALGDLQTNVWDTVMLGHYHTPQSLAKNVCYIGAQLQHGWADEGEQRGFLVLDTNTNKVTRFVLKGIPKFITVEHPIPDDLEIDSQDFVRVVFNTKPTEEELEDLQKSYPDVTVTVNPVRQDLNRSSISLGDSRREILKKYLRLRRDQTNIKLGTLLKKGMEYV